ncbi:hypothetical protein JNUCC1_03359 [Lentibacillus sp. JNUCC-1]|uniref:hypothetical protein n=1 Tax=Lentibacillus sp. JNUCC-1 TaxID=2654513 RepID=UPI0012E95978|nr:hypothetical protein [Lentibacillus sp. JNUCC-1]MUV39481.1 hypothetical protein [Lentibacillus sp. JNUCC-1]
MDKEIMKGLIHMLTNRVERLEDMVDALAEERRSASRDAFYESKEYFNKELRELDKFI